MVTVITSDGEKFVLEADVASQCGLIADFASDGGGSSEEIPIPNVTSAVMTKNPKVPLEIDDWHKEFMNVEQEMLFEIILAANYLNIKSLLDLGCATVAEMIKGKTPEEIRNLFIIMNSFTPEEEAQIAANNNE